MRRLKKSIPLIGTIVMFLLVIPFVFAATREQHFFFDNDCEDETVNNRDCTNNGCTFSSVDSFDDKAYFDCVKSESDYIDTNFNIADADATFLFRGRPKSITADDVAFGCQDTGEQRFRENLNGGLKYTVAIGDGLAATASVGPVVDQTHFIAITYTEGSNTGKIFIDGTPDASGAPSTGDKCDLIDIFLNAQNGQGTASTFADYDVFEYAVFSGIVSDGDILGFNTTHFDGSPLNPAPDPCLYSGSGDFVIDASENCRVTADSDLGGNDLIISGSGTIDLGAKIIDSGKGIINSGSHVTCRLAEGCFGG